MTGDTRGETSRSVFINCPYDAQYEPLFDAIVFAVVCCGFHPRSAKESHSVATARMERVFDAIFGSSYSIHDLSRCQGEGEELLARFNMPLELGIAMATRRAAGEGARQHEWMVLVPENAPYARFVSDLAGFDPFRYDGQVESLVKRVIGWLVTRPGALEGVRPSPVIAKLEEFRRRKAEMKAEWAEIPWPHLVRAATEYVPRA